MGFVKYYRDGEGKLLENGKNITEAALEVGFYDQSHFTKIFKETFGVTPKQFVQDFSRSIL